MGTSYLLLAITLLFMLLNILEDIAADIGLNLAVAREKNLAIIRVNQCAKEIFDAEDIAGSMREQVFDLNVLTQQVSLPHYVGEFRGWRYYDARMKIAINDLQPRYHYGRGSEVWLLKHRFIGKFPLARFISNQSVLRITSAIPTPEEFTISISGRTPNSAAVTEKLTFAVGDTIKQTVNNWIEVTAIAKNVQTTYDQKFTDLEGNDLGTFPNASLTSEFTIIQVLDYESTNYNTVDCLYKVKFYPFKDDYDVFCCGNEYDKAIYWKYMEHEASRREDKDTAIAALLKCNSIVKQISNSKEIGVEKLVGFCENPYMNLRGAVIPLSQKTLHYT